MTEVGMIFVDFKLIEFQLIDRTKFDSFEKQRKTSFLFGL